MIANMSEKKRWISKIFSQESQTDPDISWSSSDSDEEKQQPLKRFKIIESAKMPQTWLNLNITPPKNSPQISRNCSQDSFLQSPIISQINLEDQSPVLTQSDISSLKEPSPVISRNSIIKKLKWRCKRKPKDVSLSSEKSVESSQSQVIIDSLTQSSNKEEIDISPVKSEVSQSYQIECVSSQNSTEVISESSSFSNSKSSPYSHPPPKRKRFKKGGLASHLQKALSLQASSAAIWQHEVFLNKSKGVEVQDLHINFYISEKWTEYGCFILECQCKNTADSKTLSSMLEHTQNIDFNLFLLITGSNNESNVCLEVNNLYQVFQPFSTKVIIYKSKKTICVLNASRFAAV